MKKICAFIVIMVTVFGVADYFASCVFYAKATSDIDASAVIGPSATIALSTHNIAFSVLPSVEGTLGKSDALIVSTYTNNDFNCDVTMVADSPNLTYSTYTIPTLEAGTTYTDATFTNNSWGYQIENGNYNAVLTESANLIKTISTMTGSTPDTTNIYFAAKFNTAVKAGNYTNTITFTSTCTPPPPLTYMQDINEATLTTLMPNVGDTTTLYDKRDENGYAVTKLADGYYWMTQNLRLGRGNGEIIALNSTNSDLPSGTTFNLRASGMGSNQPDATGDCKVGDWHPNNNNETEINTSHLCINTNNTETYGVHYNWYAATAGTGTYNVTSGKAAGSICPKGWILPPNSGERSYYNLLFTKGGLSNDDTSATAMQTTPYNFPLSGISFGNGISSIGIRGGFWSSTAFDGSYAYILGFRSSNIYPQYNYYKSYGLSVRCVFNPQAPTFAVTASIDSGVSSVTFTAGGTTQTATTSSPTVSLTEGVSYTITANLESGYEFSGWTSGANGTLTSSSTNPTTYTVTGATTLSATSTSTAPAKTYMQNISAATLASLMPNVGDEVVLYDNRDEKDYTVAKLADGNYWMTQNLDHDIVTTAGYYTPQNTDIPSAWTPSTATYTTGTTTWDMTATGYTTPQSYDPGDLCWDGTINENWDGTLNDETTTCGSDKHMHIGNYYNWTSAVAMNDSSSYTVNNTDVDQSICPAGWMLPKSGTTQTGSKSFQYLWDRYRSSFNENTMMNSPLYFSYAGFWQGSSSNVGSYVLYWSSVVYESNAAYAFSFGPGNITSPKHLSIRVSGNSIRCVAR